jgi:peptidylprolyl isomerase
MARVAAVVLIAPLAALAACGSAASTSTSSPTLKVSTTSGKITTTSRAASAMTTGNASAKTTVKPAATKPAPASAGKPPATDGPFPEVTGAAGTKPTISIPAGDPSPVLQLKVLDSGTGATVTAGQQISVHYLGVVWPGGAMFDNSYDRGQPATFPIGTGGVIPGWDNGLVGQKVGSRVLLVIPPNDGYGPNGNARANIKGTDTLVFVVEILAAK